MDVSLSYHGINRMVKCRLRGGVGTFPLTIDGVLSPWANHTGFRHRFLQGFWAVRCKARLYVLAVALGQFFLRAPSYFFWRTGADRYGPYGLIVGHWRVCAVLSHFSMSATQKGHSSTAVRVCPTQL